MDDFDDKINPVTVALAKALKDGKALQKSVAILEQMVDGEPVNKNPITEIPAPQMLIYGFSGILENVFFDTEEELEAYVETLNDTYKKHAESRMFAIEYLGSVLGQKDVIRKTYKNHETIFLTAVDKYGYGVYNEEISIYRHEVVWEYRHGDIKSMYSAFRDRGIVFEDDIYARIEDQNRKLMQFCVDNNLF